MAGITLCDHEEHDPEGQWKRATARVRVQVGDENNRSTILNPYTLDSCDEHLTAIVAELWGHHTDERFYRVTIEVLPTRETKNAR